MTAILTCITTHYVIQVSDRRLTRPDGRLFEDEENKTVFYSNIATFAYTGLARLGWEHTDEWLLEQLADSPDLYTAIQKLPTAATDKFRSLPLPGLTTRERSSVRRTVFVGAGFVTPVGPIAERLPKGPDGQCPVFFRISNALDQYGAWLPEAKREFVGDTVFFPSEGDVFLQPSGQPFKETRLKTLIRQIKRTLSRTSDPYPAARLLAREIQALARENKTVGPNVMCNFVERPIGGFTPSFFSGGMAPLYEEFASEAGYFRRPRDPSLRQRHGYVYLPSTPYQTRHAGPCFAAPNFMMRNMKMEIIGHSEDGRPIVNVGSEIRRVR